MSDHASIREAIAKALSVYYNMVRPRAAAKEADDA
jgi:hypothetical protein